MKNTEATKTFDQMTREEKIEALTKSCNDWAASPKTISFGKTPKDGWKESDRIAK